MSSQETSFLRWDRKELTADVDGGTYRLVQDGNGKWRGFFQPKILKVPNAEHPSLFVVMEVCERHALHEQIHGEANQ